jgi:hypothetical protein
VQAPQLTEKVGFYCRVLAGELACVVDDEDPTNQQHVSPFTLRVLGWKLVSPLSISGLGQSS